LKFFSKYNIKMGGGLMQLVAYGAQDIYLTGNPQITFFKVVYRRHTNFSMEAIEQTFNGNVSYGGNVSATISRNGDLVHRMFVEWTPSSSGKLDTGEMTTSNIGHLLLKEIELEIGGQMIDKHYSHWLTTYSELVDPNPSGAKAVTTGTTGVQPTSGVGILGATKYQIMSYNHKGAVSTVSLAGGPDAAFVPLQFWFCRNPGLALPLIALQYHEVKVNINFCAIQDLIVSADGVVELSLMNPKLWCDYIYLDTDERRRFAQVSHEYLIEQLQFDSLSGGTMDLNFNHPVKELIWIGTPVTATASINITAGASTPTVVGEGTYQLKLNGHDRFAARNFKYFTESQVWQHHTGYGGTTVINSIAVYSFALKPEEHQPSGTCNFSRIDNAQLVEGTNTTPIYIYAINYNVLRIMSGMGGLAYSN
jgi:hypothetical protein